MKEEYEKIDDKLIISQINKFEFDIQAKLRLQFEQNALDAEEYYLVNKSWINKYISLNQKEELYKELIYFILKKISFNPRKYTYQSFLKKYDYYNNIRIIPKNIFKNLLSIINNEGDNNTVIEKLILIESKIILILENDNSLEILNDNYYPQYLLYFGENKNMNIDKMINIFVKEMKLKIPESINKNSIIFDYVTCSKNFITIINLNILLNKEKINSNKIREDNNNIMNKLWEDKFKLKLEKNFEEINNKLKADYQIQINQNTEDFNQKIKEQMEEQNKIFTENYTKSVIKLNNLKEEEKEEEEKEEKEDDKEDIIINNDNKNLENKIFDDYFVIIGNNKKFNIMEIKDKDKICSIFSPVLFCFSQMTTLTQYFKENEELIELYKYVEDTLCVVFFEFFKRLQNLDSEKINLSQKGIFKENSNLVFNYLISKMNENSEIIHSPGDLLSMILENLEIEQDKYFKYVSEDESRIELNKNKIYDIYNEQDMLQKFVDSHSIEHKTFIYEKFHNIVKASRLCKVCKKCSYNYKSFPTLKIPLNRSKSLISPNQPDYEIYNALLCKICFPDNLSQLLSPSYDSIKKEFCENCNKYNEIIYNNNIFAVKEYLIVNLDRENDPKNEMIFIYPEILDLRGQSKCIINLYQLVGVICKIINENDNNVEDKNEENSKYISYFKMKKSNKWIVFDENYKLSELQNNEKIFNFKGVSVLIYWKIEDNQN